MKLVYIIGLGHSGSTFLQLTLAKYSDMVGLGEIAMLIKKIQKGIDNQEIPICSCGETIEQCDFWQDVYPNILDENRVQAFEKILIHADQKYPQKSLIDASKTLKGFKTYYSREIRKNKDLKVLFLIRDYRSWLHSTKKTRIRKNRKIRGTIFESYRWLIHNLKIYFYLKKHKISYKTVIYEDLVFQFEKNLQSIFDYLEENILEERQSYVAHDIYGNRMKNQSKKKSGMYYDHTWIQKSRNPIISSLLFPQKILMNFFYTKSQDND